MTRARDDRVARLLLGLCSVLASALVLLGAYVLRSRARVQRLQAELGQKVDLQRRLMEQIPSDHCLYPHFKNSIGYVFNPFMKEGTLWGPKDGPYAINPLGLRGPGIGEAAPGRKRIVLVGDSWFFGWLLGDEDKLEGHLRALLHDVAWEVVTVAIPGWNVRSEAAYLESHIRYLDPDVVLWEICPNDTWEVGAVIPPGSLSWSISPQNPEPDSNAFTQINAVMPALPAILERYTRNLRLMDSVRARYGVPIVAAPVDIPPALWALLVAKSGVDLPTQFIPAADQADPRSRISNHDGHPTAWMNRRLALGYTARLVDLGVLPPLSLTRDDEAVAAAWRAANPRPAAGEAIEAYLRSQTAGLPEAYAEEADFARAAAGLLDGARMARHGLLHLRVPARRSAVTLEFEAGAYADRFVRELELEVRNVKGRRVTVRRRFSGAPQRLSCEAVLPGTSSRDEAWELEWRFNYDECDYPTRCFAGRMLRVSSR